MKDCSSLRFWTITCIFIFILLIQTYNIIYSHYMFSNITENQRIIVNEIKGMVATKMDDRYRGSDARKDFDKVDSSITELTLKVISLEAKLDRHASLEN